MEKMSCFKCKNYKTCYFRHTVSDSMFFDSNHPEWHEKHKQFYEAVAYACRFYLPMPEATHPLSKDDKKDCRTIHSFWRDAVKRSNNE